MFTLLLGLFEGTEDYERGLDFNFDHINNPDLIALRKRLWSIIPDNFNLAIYSVNIGGVLLLGIGLIIITCAIAPDCPLNRFCCGKRRHLRRFQEQSNSILLYKKGFQLSKRTLNSPEKSMKPETEIVEKMHVNCTCTGYDEEYMKNVHVQSASRTRYSTTSASFPLEFKKAVTFDHNLSH
ncbi:uncharacterized protein LOC111700298 [Eurytemora carolleeae]|uniref:uncharacterized protein LOC111700298 n=1 Tax=Eurytemora carolleeae TaxID=1294199 RepID=UPI000C77CC20|nr:uncharacterized protein LOC111700298 [Eurytemora carolleeae]|eukprot:XP_023326937.1 uncharacterized protein LOC111700298 [Eurytemora affinis]